MCIERGTVDRVATVANEKALFVTLVDRIPWFDAHWSQFFAEFDWFVVTTSCLDTYISRYGDFCANDNNDDTTDYFTSCACAWGNYQKSCKRVYPDMCLTSHSHLEEFLVKDEGHSTDLLHSCFFTSVVVLEVSGDGKSQFSPQLLPVKARHTTFTCSLRTCI